MLSDVCRERDAPVTLTHAVKGEVNVLHLCQGCAAERGIETSVTTPLKNMIADYLPAVQAQAVAAQVESIRCSFCSMSLGDFREAGRLGCASCYTTFDQSLRALLRRVHGNARHVGRQYEAPPPDLEVTPVDGVGGSLRMFATMLNGDLARRSNEYFGVAPGNWWDSVVTTTADVQLKPGDFIEMLVQPRCLADWDLSGAVNSQDFFAFLVEFFEGTADVNNSGDVSSQDFFDFLTAFFAGCT